VLRQSASTLQICPWVSLHIPVLSQVFAPEQLSASSAPATTTHVPPPLVQAWHIPHDACVQQWLSTQLPVEQSFPVLQVLPGFALHAPVASQVLVLVQLSGSSADFTATQVPPAPVQTWQMPHVDCVQQCPSTQLPDRQ
jgi:hypothetical protein